MVEKELLPAAQLEKQVGPSRMIKIGPYVRTDRAVHAPGDVYAQTLYVLCLVETDDCVLAYWDMG
ncbi:MAG: hypothetical protein LBS00_05190 [Synergistaceae bacterium]|nr:hypothetical protein [Synergistaceae bacterium]